MNDGISLNSDKKFSCIKCNYNSDSKRDYLKHQSTNKHKKLCNQIDDNTIKSEQKEFVCACGKKYKYRQGLHSHKQKCTFVETNIIWDIQYCSVDQIRQGARAGHLAQGAALGSRESAGA